MAKILVTGGCGYIGSHVVRQLSEQGFEVVVLDNLSTGFKDALIHGETLCVGDLADAEFVRSVFQKHRFEGMLHFAASIVVPESVAKPLDYYDNNTANTIRLLKFCQEFQVKHVIFSSTAAIYGNGSERPVLETDVPAPENPYAKSKLMDEWILEDWAKAFPVRYVVLRYFNVAGADPQGRMGQRFPNATHLIKVACETAVGTRSEVRIFGTDYATPDGTGVRDYIHIEDLADAHLVSLKYLMAGGESQLFNCGYGKGYSVREVLQQVKEISSVDFKVVESPRRPGDVGSVISSCDKIKTKLQWRPRHADLKGIVRSAYEWEKKMARK